MSAISNSASNNSAFYDDADAYETSADIGELPSNESTYSTFKPQSATARVAAGGYANFYGSLSYDDYD